MGAGVLATVLHGAALRRRILVGAAVGLGFLGPGLVWLTEFHLLGYALAVLAEATLFALGVVLVPSVRAGAVGLPAALVLAEAVRGVLPFGGVPIAILAQTQIGGPMAATSRVGGGLLVSALVGVAGVALAGLARRAWPQAIAAGAVVVVVVVASAAAPRGRPVGSLETALVQVGGERGLRAVENRSAPGFQAVLGAASGLPPGLDLLLLPEDAVRVDREVESSERGRAVAEVARSLGATVVAGVSESRGDRFVNLAAAWSPEGELVDTYQKVRLVPFGEYVPFRRLLEDLVDLRAVPRDAIPGEGPGLLDTPAGDLGVVVSYEVFFPRRARAAVREGAEVLLVPTNASSYPTTQMPALELGAARLRALETGRAVVQAAPTGFSAIVDAEGDVRHRSDLGAPAVLTAGVERRTGTTLYTRTGDAPMVVGAAVVLAAAWASGRIRRPPRFLRRLPA